MMLALLNTILLTSSTTTTGIDLTTIIVTLIGALSAGGAVKIYNAWSQSRKAKRAEENEPDMAFREDLLNRVASMSSKLEEMYDNQLKLATQNAELKTELKSAHKEITELRAEIKVLKGH